jgi:hypothetical protein
VFVAVRPAAAAVCPHYRRYWPVLIYEVAKRPRVGITDPDHSTDDAYDLRGLTPVAVVGPDGPPGARASR